jgi:acetyltransferase-like isoleucine patch superfamily enzyme
MTLRRLRKLLAYAPNILVPNILKNTFISLRTKSFVSPKADIYHSSRVRLGRNCIVDACLIDANTSQKPGIVIGDSCLFHRNTVLRAVNGSIHIGNNVSVQHFSAIYGLGNTFIGDNVLVASHCAIAAAQHNFDRKDIPIAEQGTRDMDTHIGSDVWIGAHVIIFSGVTIGEGSIIGAGSVVNRDIPAYSVAVGAPARVIRKR